IGSDLFLGSSIRRTGEEPRARLFDDRRLELDVSGAHERAHARLVFGSNERVDPSEAEARGVRSGGLEDLAPEPASARVRRDVEADHAYLVALGRSIETDDADGARVALGDQEISV